MTYGTCFANARIGASPEFECKNKTTRHIAMPGQLTTTPANIHGETLGNIARNKTAEAVMRAQTTTHSTSKKKKKIRKEKQKLNVVEGTARARSGVT